MYYIHDRCLNIRQELTILSEKQLIKSANRVWYLNCFSFSRLPVGCVNECEENGRAHRAVPASFSTTSLPESRLHYFVTRLMNG